MTDLEIITLTEDTVYNMSDGERCQDEEISYKGDSRQGVCFCFCFCFTECLGNTSKQGDFLFVCFLATLLGQGLNQRPLQWHRWVSTTRTPGRSHIWTQISKKIGLGPGSYLKCMPQCRNDQHNSSEKGAHFRKIKAPKEWGMSEKHELWGEH